MNTNLVQQLSDPALVEGVAKSLMGDWVWLFVAGVAVLLFREIIQEFAAGLGVYFSRQWAVDEIVYLNGSVELAPLVGLADAIVDITETGETIKKNNLKVVDVVKEVCCKLVVNKTSQKTVGKEIRFFISSLLK